MDNPGITGTGNDIIIKLRWSSLTMVMMAALLAVGVFFFWRSGQRGRALGAFAPGSGSGVGGKAFALIVGRIETDRPESRLRIRGGPRRRGHGPGGSPRQTLPEDGGREKVGKPI